MKVRRIGGAIVGEHFFHAVDDSNGGGGPGFINAHQHAALAVGENDVGLRSKAIAHVGDVLHVDGGAIDSFDRQVIEFLHGLRAAVHLDGVFQGAEFGGARREDEVLRVHRIDDVNRGKAFGLECLRVDVHADHALLAAIGVRSGSALHGRELRADEIVAEVEKLLLAHGIAGQA